MYSVSSYLYSVKLYIFSLILYVFSQLICIQSHLIYIQSTDIYSVPSYMHSVLYVFSLILFIFNQLICIQSLVIFTQFTFIVCKRVQCAVVTLRNLVKICSFLKRSECMSYRTMFHKEIKQTNILSKRKSFSGSTSKT